MDKKAQQTAVMTGQTPVDQAKAAEKAAIKAREAAEAKAAADRAAAEKAKADAAKATSGQAPGPPAAPSAPVAPGTANADDKTSNKELRDAVEELLGMLPNENEQNADFGNEVKKLVGKIWGMIADTKQDEVEESAVAGVRGAISWRDEQAKTAKKVTDKIKGGEATGVDIEKLDKKQLDMGEKVEMEHTDNPEIAREIASDHLAEELKEGKEKDDQEYYTKLKKVHEDKCSAGAPAFWRRNLDYGSR